MCKVARVSFQLAKGNAGRDSPSFVLCGTNSGAILYSLSREQWARVSGAWMSHSDLSVLPAREGQRGKGFAIVRTVRDKLWRHTVFPFSRTMGTRQRCMDVAF